MLSYSTPSYTVLHRQLIFFFRKEAQIRQLGSYVASQANDANHLGAPWIRRRKRKPALLMFYDLARTNDMRMSSDSSLRSSFEGVRSRVVILAETGFRQRKNTLLGFVEARIKETLGLDVERK